MEHCKSLGASSRIVRLSWSHGEACGTVKVGKKEDGVIIERIIGEKRVLDGRIGKDQGPDRPP